MQFNLNFDIENILKSETNNNQSHFMIINSEFNKEISTKSIKKFDQEKFNKELRVNTRFGGGKYIVGPIASGL